MGEISFFFQTSEFAAHIKDIENQQRAAEQYCWMICVVYDLELPDVPGGKKYSKKRIQPTGRKAPDNIFCAMSNIFTVFCGFIEVIFWVFRWHTRR